MASAMAENQAHIELGIPDDTMEISSDIGRQGDEDIEIDFDLPGGDISVGDDYFMLDDNPTDAQDDVMLEGATTGDNFEQSMEDHQDYEDEELGDATLAEEADSGLAGYYEQTFDNTTILAGGDNSVDSTLVDQPFDGDLLPPTDVPTFPSHDSTTLPPEAQDPYPNDPASAPFNLENEDLALEAPAGLEREHPDDFETGVEHVSDGSSHEAEEEAGESDAMENPAAEPESASPHPDIGSDDSADRSTQNYETAVAEPEDVTETARHAQENSDSEEDDIDSPHLHPFVVLWEDDEIPLFPNEQDLYSEFFVEDVSVAKRPLRDLFNCFRDVLGDHVDQSHLEIHIAELGLMFSEGSPTHGCTLAEIADIYLQLSHNDGNEHPGPLRLALTAVTSFAARLAQLRESVTEGHGISHLNAPYHEDLGDDSGRGVGAGDALVDETDAVRTEDVAEQPDQQSWESEVQFDSVEGSHPQEDMYENEESNTITGNEDLDQFSYDPALPEQEDFDAYEAGDAVEDVHPTETSVAEQERHEEDLLDFSDEDEDANDQEQEVDDSGRSSTIQGDESRRHEAPQLEDGPPLKNDANETLYEAGDEVKSVSEYDYLQDGHTDSSKDFEQHQEGINTPPPESGLLDATSPSKIIHLQASDEHNLFENDDIGAQLLDAKGNVDEIYVQDGIDYADEEYTLDASTAPSPEKTSKTQPAEPSSGPRKRSWSEQEGDDQRSATETEVKRPRAT